MTKKELQKISLQYRTLASQMLKINSQEEMYCIQQFFDFINETSFLMSYIDECITEEYDFKSIFEEKGWRDILELPSNQKELISYGFQLIKYILDGPKQLIGLCMGYTSSNKFSDNIEAFMRKSIEPFVVAVRTYIELNFIDANDENANIDKTVKTVFLSYCQKDKDIADCIDEKMGKLLEGTATLSRDMIIPVVKPSKSLPETTSILELMKQSRLMRCVNSIMESLACFGIPRAPVKVILWFFCRRRFVESLPDVCIWTSHLRHILLCRQLPGQTAWQKARVMVLLLTI